METDLSHYVDIRIKNIPDISEADIVTKVFNRLHVLFVDNGKCFALGFPKYFCSGKEKGIGNIIRIFGSREKLNELNLFKQFFRMADDYITITEVKAVPAQIKGFVKFSRVQPLTNAMIRRLLKRHPDVTKKELNNFKSKKEKDLPYVITRSLSNKNRFSLFIKKESCTDKVSGCFNGYGLSCGGAVPVF